MGVLWWRLEGIYLNMWVMLCARSCVYWWVEAAYGCSNIGVFYCMATVALTGVGWTYGK